MLPYPRTVARLFAAAAVLAALSLGAAPATAQEAERFDVRGIAVIDTEEVLKRSKAGQSVMEQRQSYLDAYQDKVAKEEKALRGEDEELQRQRAILAPDAFEGKRDEFRQRLTQFKRDVELRRRAVAIATDRAFKKIGAKQVDVTHAYAKENDINLVLHNSQLFLFDSAFDISDAIVERLDATLPEVEMEDPEKLMEEALKRREEGAAPAAAE